MGLIDKIHCANIKNFFRCCFLLSIGVLICGLLAGCHHHSQIDQAPHWFQQYKFFEENDYQQYNLAQIEKITDNTIIFSAQVRDFYQAKEGTYWTANGYQEQRIDSFVDFLSHSYEDGLPPAALGHEGIIKTIETIKSGEIKDAPSLYRTLWQLEIALTKAYIHYAKALAYGAADPKMVYGQKWLYEMDSITPQFITSTLAATDTAVGYLRSLSPVDSNYVALKQELKKYLRFKDTTFATIPYIVAKEGGVAKNIHLIGERLQLLEEIGAQYTASDTLTPTLMKAINRFRTNRAIPVSNELDEETMDALNWQPQTYINKLVVNMDRLRWRTANKKGASYIAVNVPDFTLEAWNADTFALKSRICCGKYKAYEKPVDTYKKNGILPPRESETPMLYGEINYVVLNPEWKIPPKIIKDEYYAKMVKNSARVINREKLFIVDGRTHKRVIPETILWNKVNPKNNPYQLIQSSGTHNALGLIKFNFPNGESVYLHDTNNKGAFKRRNRALSHGCVRVEQPLELATLLFQMNDYDEEEMEQVMIILGEEPVSEEGEEFLEKRLEAEQKYYESLGADTIFYRPLRPTNKMLKKKMPVFFEYYTCFTDETGTVQYRPDIYYKEENMLYSIENMCR